MCTSATRCFSRSNPDCAGRRASVLPRRALDVLQARFEDAFVLVRVGRACDELARERQGLVEGSALHVHADQTVEQQSHVSVPGGDAMPARSGERLRIDLLRLGHAQAALQMGEMDHGPDARPRVLTPALALRLQHVFQQLLALFWALTLDEYSRDAACSHPQPRGVTT